MALFEQLLQTLIAAIAGGAFRNVTGYLKTALEDGKIEKYEWKMLGSKMVEAVFLTVALVAGTGITPEQAAGAAVLLSYGRSTIESSGSK